MSIPPYDLDVRPILREGGEPFSVIMEAVAALAPGQSLRLTASFKPVPLFQVMGARGFEPSAREIGGGDWEVIFMPQMLADNEDDAVAEPETVANETGEWPEPSINIDNRELEPPEPMVRTLEMIEKLAPGETLAALLPREPLFLFKELETRQYQWRGAQEPDGSYRIVIRAARANGTSS